MTLYHRILVPLDGSVTAERGLHEAIGLAAEQNATLHLLHVVDDYRLLVDTTAILGYQDFAYSLRRDGESLLDKATRTVAEAGVQAETSLRQVTQESVADVIVDEAKASACELIVMGTHGRRGVARLAMGSQAELVVRTSPVPVLLVRQSP